MDCLVVTIKFSVAETQLIVMITLKITNRQLIMIIKFTLAEAQLLMIPFTIVGTLLMVMVKSTLAVIQLIVIIKCTGTINGDDKIHNCCNTLIVMIRFTISEIQPFQMHSFYIPSNVQVYSSEHIK